MSGPTVICGARGFVGSHLLPRLLEDGVEIRAGSRNPEAGRLEDPRVDWVRVDVNDPPSLHLAFEGADTVYYLVHQMRETGDLESIEVAGARAVLKAAESQGVRRIVYLGATLSSDPSHHLQARAHTGEVLRSGTVSTIELRAGMIIGPGSESWLIVRDLACRLPVMALPRWLQNRSQPIAIGDVIAALCRARTLETSESRVYDLPGPEELSAREILLRVARQRGMRPMMVAIPFLSPGLSCHWIRLVTRADFDVARQLVDGLTSDLVSEGPGFWAEMDSSPTPLDTAIRRALEDEAGLGRRAQQLERFVRWIARPARDHVD